MRTATLSWFADRGFELDVEASDDEVALRLAAVPVPADGTDELRAGVKLDRLDILFKASVKIQGETAQLLDARITLVSDDDGTSLAFDAKCEDVETGDTVPVRMTLPVAVPEEAPASGGPRPVPTNEDDLDWEDETTLEQMVVNAPDAPDEDEEEDEPRPSAGKGLQALLKALADLDDEPSEAGTEADDDSAADADDEDLEDLRTAPRRGNNPPEDEALEPPPADPADQSLGAEGEARSLLDLLVGGDHLELDEDGDLNALVPGVTGILALPLGSEAKATRLSSWLLEQPQVADLFIDDEELAEILERW